MSTSNLLPKPTSPPLVASGSSSTLPCNAAWPNFTYPARWEMSNDYMCVHFIPRTADRGTWASQCSFWGEAVALYAQQLLHECPFEWSRLTFTAQELQRAYARSNGMIPMCISDILHSLSTTPSSQPKIMLSSWLEQHYTPNSTTTPLEQQPITNNNPSPDSPALNLSLLSAVSTTFTSMLGYFASSDSEYSDDDEANNNNNSTANQSLTNPNTSIKDKTRVLYTPIMDQLCQDMSHLRFYKTGDKPSTSSDKTSALSELMDIGIISLSLGEECDSFIVNGLVFHRFCVDCLRFTEQDILLIKKYLILKNIVKLLYVEEPDMLFGTSQSNNNLRFSTSVMDNETANLKDEMLCFNVEEECADILRNEEHASKLHLLSINLTMKHLQLQKSHNEQRVQHINRELLDKLKGVASRAQRSKVMQCNKILIERKKALKNRISSLDGSIYNLETTLHSMEDVKINRMVFDEMKQADKMLKFIISNGPSVEEVSGMQEGIKQSMQVNESLGDMLATGMDMDQEEGIGMEELLKEYEEMEAAEAEEAEMMLPQVPAHEVLIRKEVADEVHGTQHEVSVVENRKVDVAMT